MPAEWTGKTRGGRAGNAFFVWLITHGFLGLTPFFLFFVSLWFAVFNPKGRRASNEFAKRLGRRGGLFWTWKHNFMFGTLLIDRVAVLNGLQSKYAFDASNKTILMEELARGNGLVLVTAHIGSWELMGQMLDFVEVPVSLVMHENMQPQVRRLLTAGRSFKVIETDGSPAAAAAILDALGRGEVVGTMGDRLLADEGVVVDFLGGRARFPVGPYAVAAAARAPVAYAFCVRNGRRDYDFPAVAAGVPRYRDRRNKQADHERWAGEFAKSLEEHVRARPTQWCNFYSFWETE